MTADSVPAPGDGPTASADASLDVAVASPDPADASSPGRAPLTLVELRRVVEAAAAAEQALFVTLGELARSGEPPASAALLATWCHRHAWHAELWRDRIAHVADWFGADRADPTDATPEAMSDARPWAKDLSSRSPASGAVWVGAVPAHGPVLADGIQACLDDLDGALTVLAAVGSTGVDSPATVTDLDAAVAVVVALAQLVGAIGVVVDQRLDGPTSRIVALVDADLTAELAALA